MFSVNEMSKDHGMSDYKEEVIVPKKREEAKNRYEKFQQLAHTGEFSFIALGHLYNFT